ncbi:MAG: hypothetical protein A2X71_03705 [Thiobacillus sp. GWE1_62_9]|nr:MAG: hypothetical protein A2X71_03705 [Thiobacillus sp. GWE1_62_9]
MYNEAMTRLDDADLLSRSLETQSDSQSLLRILGFEVLLKCALVLCGQTPKKNHVYAKLWRGLPGYAQKEILAAAQNRMPGHADLTNLDRLFGWYQFVFERARYHFELYEKYSLEEQHELGSFWEELGAPIDEAVVQYHPNELTCLIDGLRIFIEARLYNTNAGPHY